MATLEKKPQDKPKNAHAMLKSLPPPPQTLVDSKNSKTYTTGQWIGEGGFARCYLVNDQNNAPFAVKVVAKISLTSPKQRQKLVSEIRVHSTLSHQYICKFYCCFEDDNNVYMILELCENKTLMEYVRKRKRFTESEARFYMLQLLDAVEYMHEFKVIHRDLKLGNLFLTASMDLKIGDFGLAANIKHDGDRKRTICGTPNYIAPEVLFDTQNGHSYEVDIWSIGVIMYTLLIGKPPFQTKEVNAIYKRIKENTYEFPESIPISPNAKNVIQGFLHSRPECRPMAKDIKHHVFFVTGYLPHHIPKEALTVIPSFEGIQDMNANKEVISTQVLLPRAEKILPGKNDWRPVSTRVNPVRAAIPSSWILESQDPLPKSTNDKENREIRGRVESMKPQAKESRLSDKTESKLLLIPPQLVTKVRQVVPKVVNTVVEFVSPAPRKLKSTTPVLTPVKTTVDVLIDELNQHHISSPQTSNSDSLRKQTKSLEIMHNTLDFALNEFKAGTLVSHSLAPEDKHVNFIIKWIDYSNKYGLGYQLRDGTVGVHFNDATSIVLAKNGKVFEYLANEQVAGGQNQLCRDRWEMATYPKELRKKVTLLKHFKAYMNDNLFKGAEVLEERTTRLDYLSKYFRNKHGVIFRLSSQAFQINLVDHTKIILSKGGEVVTYMDNQRELHFYGLNEALLSGDRVLVERLRFAKDMLYQMMVKKQERQKESVV